MALFTIADTHLSFAAEKPMDVFGARWENHAAKIKERWENAVTDEDTVVLPGDISWGMTIKDALPDFLFLSSLPGKKIISKGNHDYYWSSLKKLNDAFAENGIDNISLLHNNCFVYGDIAICGSRGWYPDERNNPQNADYEKLINREAMRIEFSLKSAEEQYPEKEKLLFLHFPPLWRETEVSRFTDIIKSHGVKRCFFGHIHGDYSEESPFTCDGVEYRLISSDYLDFKPFKIEQ